MRKNQVTLPFPARIVEDLAVTAWRLVEVRPDGIVLRDGPPDRWAEETLWVAGVTPGRTYAIRWEGGDYEFRSQLATWNPYTFERRTFATVRRRAKSAA